jgi:predicted dinucleotide-binding enzyme
LVDSTRNLVDSTRNIVIRHGYHWAIGAGNIGAQVARLAVAHGHDVVISNSRGLETLSALITELGPKARAATAVDAATAGETVVVSIPLKHYVSVPVEPLAGRL